MLHSVGRSTTPPAIDSFPVRQKHDQNNHKGERADGTAPGRTIRGVRILTALVTIPNLSKANENENERPVRPEDGPRIKRRTPIAVEDDRANGDKENRKNEGGSTPGIAVLSHHAPLHSLLRVNP